jgi:hypothetical protein
MPSPLNITPISAFIRGSSTINTLLVLIETIGKLEVNSWQFPVLGKQEFTNRTTKETRMKKGDNLCIYKSSDTHVNKKITDTEQ